MIDDLRDDARFAEIVRRVDLLVKV